MIPTVEVDDTRAVARLSGTAAKVNAALVAKVTMLRLQLEARIKQKLSGQVLNVVSGNLRRSIFSEQTNSPAGVVASIGSSGDVKYGRIHEYGGKTAAHVILPTKAKALAFMVGGKMVFAKRVNHPGSVMPERSFMRSSFAEMRVQIVEEIAAAVGQAAHH